MKNVNGISVNSELRLRHVFLSFQYCNGGDLAEYLHCKLAIWAQISSQLATV